MARIDARGDIDAAFAKNISNSQAMFLSPTKSAIARMPSQQKAKNSMKIHHLKDHEVTYRAAELYFNHSFHGPQQDI